MKFTVLVDPMIAALTLATKIVSRRNTIPILSNVLISASSERVTISATDMDVLIKIPLTVTGTQRGGETTASAHGLLNLLKTFPKGAEVEIEHSKGSDLCIRHGRTLANTITLMPEDWPTMMPDHATRRGIIEVEAPALLERMAIVETSMSAEETRYYLNGICFDQREPDRIAMVSTDGHRLSLQQVSFKGSWDKGFRPIVGRLGVSVIKALLNKRQDVISMTFTDTRVTIEVGDITVTAKLIDGPFPDYDRVIPHQNTRTMTVAARDFGAAVKRVAAIKEGSDRGVRLTLNGSIRVWASSADSGQITTEVDGVHNIPAHAPFDIGFNSRYLLEIIGATAQDQLTMSFGDPGAPAVIPHPDGLFVLMPMRV